MCMVAILKVRPNHAFNRTRSITCCRALTTPSPFRVGAFADPQFPAPTFSVYEERMHSWVFMPKGIERMA
jgi:hypothetical protein